MARNGSGVYSLPAADNPAVASTLIESTKFNNTMNDLATALTGSIAADGQTTITANIPMNNNKLTGLGAATATGDAIAQNKQVNGLLDLGGAAAGQIQFPATQNPSASANCLDDYEEGTFTPAITFGGGSTGLTYTRQLGLYTKIGRVVMFHIDIIINSNGSNTGDMNINGLPFTVLNTAGASFAASVWVNGYSGITTHVSALAAENSTLIAPYYGGGNGAVSVIQETNAIDSSHIKVSGHYTV